MLILHLIAIGGVFALGFYINRLVEAVRAATWFTDLKG